MPPILAAVPYDESINHPIINDHTLAFRMAALAEQIQKAKAQL